MHSIENLLSLSENQIARIQNTFLEAKSLNFRKFFVGGEYVFSENLSQKMKLEMEKKDPKIQLICELAESDPFNLVRLFSLAYSPVYLRPSLTTAVTSLIQQFGYKRLPRLMEEASGGAEGTSRNIANFFSMKALALEELQKTILTARLAKKISASQLAAQFVQEETFLAVAGMNVFRFILSCFNPDLLSTWSIDAAKNQCSLSKNCPKFFIDEEAEVNTDILRKMSLPSRFLEILINLEVAPWNKRSWTKDQHDRMHAQCSSTYIANEIITHLLSYDYESGFYNFVNDIASRSSLNYDQLMEMVSALPVEVRQNEKNLGLSFPDLPGFLMRMSEKHLNAGQNSDHLYNKNKSEIYKAYFEEIKNSLKSYSLKKDSSQLFHAVNMTLRMLVKVFKFDRAILYTFSNRENSLKVYHAFGRGIDKLQEHSIKVVIGKDLVSPVIQAFFEPKAAFNGDPVFDDDWPFVAFPICYKDENYGVFYADIASKSKAEPLSTEQQMAIINLSELFIFQ